VSLDYKKLIEAAILAPTPDNNQPWRFAVRDGQLQVFLDSARALPSDVNGMFDLAGLGAAIENACIAALEAGYQPSVTFADFPPAMLGDPKRPVATIGFAVGGKPDPFYPYLTRRSTCRKLYSKRPLPADSLAKMSQAAERFPEVRVDWLNDRSQIAEISRLIAAADLIRFEYEPFHTELFRQLRFTAEEADRTRDGLDVRTLELPLGAAWLLHKLEPWKRMQTVHRLGLGRLLTIPSAVTIRRSGAVGLLSVPEATVAQFLRGGMTFERLWLTASSLGVALQPLGSLPIYLAHWHQLGGARLESRHSSRVHELSDRLHSLMPQLGGRVVQIMFRVGQAAPSRFRSLRRKAAEVAVD
jgi:hypothetical protein